MVRGLVAVLFLLALLPSWSLGQVRVVAQFGEAEAIAVSDCPEDPPREPDFDEGYTAHLVDYFADVTAAMSSDCGEVAMHGILDVSIAGSVIAGALEAESSLADHGVGHASSTVQMTLSVTSPVDYVLVASGSTTETGGDTGNSGLQLSFAGHDTLPTDAFDVRWEGTLSPGSYSLQGWAGTERAARWVGDVFLFQNGQTTLAATFELTFTDASVVEASTTSVGRLKSRF